MTKEQRLAAYDLVNTCEDFLTLKAAIEVIGIVNNNKIQGRSREFTVESQLNGLESIINTPKDQIPNYNLLTRSYGIRQQAMYLKHYGEK